MTTPIPADMLLFFIIRMDLPMIATMLEESETYAGMHHERFLEFLEQGFERHRTIGDNTILALQGTFGADKQVGYSFMGNKSLSPFELVLVADAQKMIVDMNTDPSFVFDENSFVIRK